MNAVTANFDGVTNLSIEAKSLTTEYNTVQHAGGFSILVVFGIPAVVLILLSIGLTLLGGLIPSRKAAKSDPVTALRTE